MGVFEFIGLKYLLAAFLLVLTLISGWYPFAKRQQKVSSFPLAEAFASGVFLGAGLMHMLPDSGEMFREAGYGYPLAALIAGLMLLFLLWFEHFTREKYAQKDPKSFVLLPVIMLSVHSLLEGGALGVASNVELFSVLAIAIVGHKWAEGFALSVQINQAPDSLARRMSYYIFFALMTPIGLLAGSLIHHDNASLPLLASINSLAAGTFLYLGTLHGLSRSVMVEKCCNVRQYSFVLLGFGLMAVIAYWF